MYSIKKENTKVEVNLEVDAKEWEDAVQKTYEENKSKFNVEGFRKGHAPRKVIEKTYGDSVFFEDTINHLVNKTMNEVLDKEPDLEPVAMPTTQFESFTADGGLKMKILFEIVPDFKLCKYVDVPIEVHSAEATEKDVDNAVQRLLEDNAKFEEVEREAKNGDSLLIDFTGFMNGEEFDGGSATNYPLELGSHTFIDNFEDQLVGHKKGDIVDVKVTFPADYHAEEFQGKPVEFRVEINAVREKRLPTLDDKFISDTTEFETVEEYRKDVLAHIQTMKENDQEAEFQFNMREYLTNNTQIEIPEIMVDNNVFHEMDHMKQALEMYHLTLEDYLRQTGGGTIEDYVDRLKESTRRSIKVRYIYRKIIAENNIKVSDEELAEATKGMTKHEDIVRTDNELTLQKLYKFLEENNKKVVVKD